MIAKALHPHGHKMAAAVAAKMSSQAVFQDQRQASFLLSLSRGTTEDFPSSHNAIPILANGKENGFPSMGADQLRYTLKP